MGIQDTIYTSPDALRALYRNPRKPNSGDDITADVPAVSPQPAILPPPRDPETGGSCPAFGQYTLALVPDVGHTIRSFYVEDLLDYSQVWVWNFITSRMTRVKSIKQVEDIDCVLVRTINGAETLVSKTHPLISGPEDMDGTPVQKIIDNPTKIFSVATSYNRYYQGDEIDTIIPAGPLWVVKFELDGPDKRFATGTQPNHLIAGHNKRPPQGDVEVGT